MTEGVTVEVTLIKDALGIGIKVDVDGESDIASGEITTLRVGEGQ